MNDENLRPKPFEKGSERAREAGRKGGINSGKAKRKRREMRETLEILLNMPIDKGTCKDIEQLKNLKELKGKNITAQDAIVFALMKTALGGGRDGVAAFKEIQNALSIGNDIATLNIEELNNMNKEELMALADIDEDLEENGGGGDEYDEE